VVIFAIAKIVGLLGSYGEKNKIHLFLSHSLYLLQIKWTLNSIYIGAFFMFLGTHEYLEERNGDRR
jgi:intracellular septation protein A